MTTLDILRKHNYVIDVEILKNGCFAKFPLLEDTKYYINKDNVLFRHKQVISIPPYTHFMFVLTDISFKASYIGYDSSLIQYTYQGEPSEAQTLREVLIGKLAPQEKEREALFCQASLIPDDKEKKRFLSKFRVLEDYQNCLAFLGV